MYVVKKRFEKRIYDRNMKTIENADSDTVLILHAFTYRRKTDTNKMIHRDTYANRNTGLFI